MAATTAADSKSTPQQQPPDPPKPSIEATPDPQQTQLGSFSNPTTTPASASKSTTPPASTVVYVPSYSRWFSWGSIHECEVRILPEFFDGKSPPKNPKSYKYIRNSIIKRFRECLRDNPPTKENPTPKITFTEARKTVIGDVGSVRRVFDFLEAWGLINFHGSPSSKPQLKWDDKEGKSGNDAGTGEASATKKRVCSSCKSVCTISCFTSLKKDQTLCARCFVSGGVNSSDFKRVEISEDAKADWTDKETLLLMEAIMHYGNDWEKVAEHVGGRSEKECVNRFIKLPFGEQYMGPPDSSERDGYLTKAKNQLDGESSESKRTRLSPLADATNPIMAQAAFLSALVGVEVAEAAARAAVRALSEVDSESNEDLRTSSIDRARDQESSLATDGKMFANSTEEAFHEARLQLEKEERDLENAISIIAEVQTKEIHDKIVRFEETELRLEKERHRLKQMRSLLFADQLALQFHKSAGSKPREITEENVKTE